MGLSGVCLVADAAKEQAGFSQTCPAFIAGHCYGFVELVVGP